MQSDLLFPQREEERPESLSTQELIPSASLPLPDAAQREPSSVAEAVAPTLMPAVEKKRTKINIAVIGLSLLVILLFLAFGWVGYWAYTLNTELSTTQGQLVALQAEHAKLQTDYATLTSEHEKLNAELNQTKAHLEQANTDLTAAQADLSKSKDRGENLDAQIDVAGKLAEILYVWSMSDSASDVFKVDELVKESNNQQLIDKWNTFTRTPSDDALGAFVEYLILAIRNSVR
jgi:uncharacterized protein HemX